MTVTTAGVPAQSSAGLRVEEALLLAVTGLTAVVFAIDVQSPARTFLALAFMLVCPGLPFVRLAGVRDPLLVSILTVALSAAVDTLVAEALLYTHDWSPGLGVAIVSTICLAGLGLDRFRCVGRGLGPDRSVAAQMNPSVWVTVDSFDTLADANAKAHAMRMDAPDATPGAVSPGAASGAAATGAAATGATDGPVPPGRAPDDPVDGIAEAIARLLRDASAAALAIREQADHEAAAVVAAARLEAQTILREASETARADAAEVLRSATQQIEAAEAGMARVREDLQQAQPLPPTPGGQLSR
ncbi:MAG: hypothetical protein M3083_09065 [Actinomycetota bacterium]|nr:hypothetical protein [Actinomycetota bacterium]